jgi:hypothetical protein
VGSPRTRRAGLHGLEHPLTSLQRAMPAPPAGLTGCYHLGSGPGGIHHFLEQFTGPMTAWWADLGSPDMTSSAVQKKIVDGVLEEIGGRSVATLSEERDALLGGLLELRARHG